MIRVITIEREYGSGAADIAKKVADRLGWKLWDQSLTDEIARRMDRGRRALWERGENDAGPYQSPMEDGMMHFHEHIKRGLAGHL